MILQALCKCYDLMEASDTFDVCPMGYSKVPCAFAIELEEDGSVVAGSPIPLIGGKKGQELKVPLQPGRSGKNPIPYFLCDKSKYFLGLEIPNGKKELVETKASFENCLQKHQEILGQVDDAGAQALLRFLERVKDGYRLDVDAAHEVYQGGNLVFKLVDTRGYLHDRPALKEAWMAYWNQPTAEDKKSYYGECLVTGESDVKIARTHTMLKGILGSNTTGANLVSFNFSSAESYGKSQSYNAPVSETAMFEYTTALQTLLNSTNTRMYLGDMTCVFWAEKQMDVVTDVLFDLLTGDYEDVSENLDTMETRKIHRVLARTYMGLDTAGDISVINPDTEIYLLGLAPNVARVCVRFWYKNTFGHFVKQMKQHQADMAIIRPANVKRPVSIRDILNTMAVQGKAENVPRTLEASLMQAILNGTLYPDGVYRNILMRIRAEAGDDFSINFTRVSFIKAYLTRRNRILKQSKEEITVALNEQSTSTAYQLGRLFAVLEKLQEEAGNTGLRERYFQSASTTPAVIFPTLLHLAQHHIAKSEWGKNSDYRISAILQNVTEFPVTLSTEDQGRFILGYYHQRQDLYTKKTKEDEKTED